MKKQQSGFTLIELVVVIVILGILAAVAVPKFVDLSAEAEQAATEGVAGALGSASTINYGGCAAKDQVPTAGKCVKVSTCANADSLLVGGLPTGYVNTTALTLANGVTGTCTVTSGTAASATYTLIGAGN